MMTKTKKKVINLSLRGISGTVQNSRKPTKLLNESVNKGSRFHPQLFSSILAAQLFYY